MPDMEFSTRANDWGPPGLISQADFVRASDSLDQAVEEARADVLERMRYGDSIATTGYDIDNEVLDALIEAVSAKARAEERERYEHDLSTTWKDLALESQRQVQALLARARSSEEAEVCLHPRVSRMAAVGGPIICGVCGEEAGNGG